MGPRTRASSPVTHAFERAGRTCLSGAATEAAWWAGQPDPMGGSTALTRPRQGPPAAWLRRELVGLVGFLLSELVARLLARGVAGTCANVALAEGGRRLPHLHPTNPAFTS